MSKALNGVPGVTEAQVAIGSATVKCESTVTEEQLREALDDAGYDLLGVSA